MLCNTANDNVVEEAIQVLFNIYYNKKVNNTRLYGRFWKSSWLYYKKKISVTLHQFTECEDWSTEDQYKEVKPVNSFNCLYKFFSKKVN